MKPFYLLTIALYGSMFIVAAFHEKPSIERAPECDGYVWLHLNCNRPLSANVAYKEFDHPITEKEAYDLANSAHCGIPRMHTIKFRLQHAGPTFDYCIYFKESR